MLIHELVRRTGLRGCAWPLAIAPGTGHATLLLAKMGYRIRGVELGANVARVAAVEAVRPPIAAWNPVYVATALHWIAPKARFQKSHALLKASGHLAIIYRHDVSDDQGDAFTAATQPIYRRYAQEAVIGARAYCPDALDNWNRSPSTRSYAQVSFDTFPQVLTCSAEDDVNLLRTYSPTVAMAVRRALSIMR